MTGAFDRRSKLSLLLPAALLAAAPLSAAFGRGREGHLPGPRPADLPQLLPQLPQPRQEEGRARPEHLRRRAGRQRQRRRSSTPATPAAASSTSRSPTPKTRRCRRRRTSSPTRSWKSSASGSPAARWRRPPASPPSPSKPEGGPDAGRRRPRQADRPGRHAARTWSQRAGRPHRSAPGAVPSLAASPWAPLVAVGGQKQILLYHTADARTARRAAVPRGRAARAAVQPQRQPAAGRRRAGGQERARSCCSTSPPATA